MKFERRVRAAVLLLALLGSGCGLRDEVDGLKRQLSDIRSNTGEMHTTTAEMYDALRQGDTAVMRRSILESMMTARNPSRKVAEAAHWMMAFEFQRWGLAENRRESEAYRCQLATAAVRELLMNAQEFALSAQQVPQPFAMPSPLAAGHSDDAADELANRQMNLNALSAALHVLNPVQVAVTETNRSIAPLSVLILLEESLKLGRQLREGQLRLADLSPLVREVLSREGIARLLLQARYNFLLVAAVQRTAGLDRESLEVVDFFGMATWRIRVVALRALGLLTFGWTPEVERLNTAELYEANRALAWGLATAQSLHQAGVRPNLVGGLQRILETAKFPASFEQRELEAMSERDFLTRQHQDLLKSYAGGFGELGFGLHEGDVSALLAEPGVRGNVDTPCLKSSR